MKQLEVTDDQYRTLITVLYLAAQADTAQSAVWFDTYDREKIGNLHESVAEQETVA